LSVAAVWERDGGLRVTATVVVPARELTWRFSRSSGPGGQGVNTTDSRVELLLDVASSAAFDDHQRVRVLERLGDRLVDGVLAVTASEHRSQLRNRDAAAVRLAALLRDALAPPRRGRRPTRPTRGSQQRRLDAKSRRGETKRLRRPPTD
jgi:ribosome-associated protein